MKGHEDFIAPHILSTVFSERSRSMRVDAWIEKGAYSITNPPISKTEFTIDDSSQTFSQVLSFEICQFTTAAIESFLNSIQSKKTQANKSYPWDLISLYYASFYSSHAILRMSGRFCSKIDSVDEVNKLLKFRIPGSTPVENSFYYVEYDATSDTVKFKEIRLGPKYGSHQALSDNYSKFLDLAYSNSALTSSVHANAINEYKKYKENAKLGWLPHIRNVINYKLPAEIWYPHKLNSAFYTSFSDALKSLTTVRVMNMLWSTNEYERFAGSCMFNIFLLNRILTFSWPRFAPKATIKTHIQDCNKSIIIKHNTIKAFGMPI